MTSSASLRARSRRDTDNFVAISLALMVSGLASACSSGGLGGASVDGDAGGLQPDAHLDAGTVEVAAPVPIDVPTPTFAASRPSSDCTAALATPVAPLLLDVTISCASGGGPTSLAAGTDGGGFVAVASAGSNTATRVLSVSAQGVVSGDEGPAGADISGLVAEPSGGVNLVSLSPVDGVSFFHAVDGGWMRELLLPPGPPQAVPEERFDLDGVNRSSDGRVNLAYTHVIDLAASGAMVTRSAAGSWTGWPLPIVFPTNSAMAVLPTGAAILVLDNESSPASLELDAWSNGADSAFVSLPQASDDVVESVGAAVDAAGALTASFETGPQGVVVVRPTGASPRTVALAGTQAAMPVGCPDWPSTSPTALPSITCTQTGTGGSRRHALASADDGTIWVAYLLSHIDRDVLMSCATSFSGGSFDCGGEITTDRSTTELVLERLTTDGGHAVRWRTSIGVGDGIFLMDADVGGGRLLLAFAPAAPGASGPTFRYVALDTR
jgi:hypothetical protein